jgi:hypothetical protein
MALTNYFQPFFSLLSQVQQPGFLSDLIYSFGALEKYQLYFDGSIIAAGQKSSGFVVYARAFCALFLVICLEMITKHSYPEEKISSATQ